MARIATTISIIVITAVSLLMPAAQAAYPGANGDLYFSSRRGTTHLCIWSVNPTTGEPVKMTSGVNSPKEDWSHYWSPDGTKMIFQSDRDGDIEIYLFDSVSGAVTQLTRNKVSDEYASWSPAMADGKLRIVFQRQAPKSAKTGRDLWVMNTDGSGQQMVYSTKREERHAAWSPLGDQIAFVSSSDGDEDIYLLPVALANGVVSVTGAPRNITSQSPGADYSPDWSPDGTQLVFAREASTPIPAAGGEADIWKMSADGTGQALLMDLQLSDAQPDWSPDGTTIAFVSGSRSTGSIAEIDATWDIWTMDVNGGSLTRITNDTFGDFQPEWRNA